jgi:hypothetical protein
MDTRPSLESLKFKQPQDMLKMAFKWLASNVVLFSDRGFNCLCYASIGFAFFASALLVFCLRFVMMCHRFAFVFPLLRLPTGGYMYT